MCFRRCALRCGLLSLVVASLSVSLYSQTGVSASASPASTYASTAPANIQANVPANLQAKVRVVVLDVVVTNGKGEPVPGLHKENFELFEEGAAQTIATFEEHQGAEPTLAKLPPLPPHVYTNFPVMQTANSLNVLLLDSLNTPSRDQTYVHQQMIKYLQTIPPGTRIAIFTLASRLRMLQGATTDSTELLGVLNDKKGIGGAHESPLLRTPAEADADQQHIDFLTVEDSAPRAPQNLAQAAVDPVNSMKQFLADTAAFQTELRVNITLQAMQQLARYLSDVPGRKNLIWFSGSFPAGIVPNPELPDPSSVVRDFQQEIRKTTNLLAASQIAIYPIAAEGLAPDAVFEANGSQIGQTRPSMTTQQQVRHMRTEGAGRDFNHNTMEELAKDTGGEAIYNTNGLKEALVRVVENGTHYYTLSYTPSDKNMDGKFRRIRVNLTSGKHNLAYRRGYFADDLGSGAAAARNPDIDPLFGLMGRNLPDLSQIIYKIRVLPSSPQPALDAPRIGSNTDLQGPVTRYSVEFAISAPDLKLDPTADGGRRGNIEVMLVAYDREGKPLNFVKSSIALAVPAKVYADILKVGLQIRKEIDVPKEDVYLRTGIYDIGTDAAGTLGIPLHEELATPAKMK
jgi:VWFA-related protein